jgi:hypothetical protein
MGAITAMVVSSIGARLPGVWVPVGAVLFLISDAILAANRFKTPIPGRDYLVWGTYYFGQMLIALAYVTQWSAAPETTRSPKRRRNGGLRHAQPDAGGGDILRGANQRQEPMLVAAPISRHAPSRHASTANASTRWPSRRFSRTRTVLNV